MTGFTYLEALPPRAGGNRTKKWAPRIEALVQHPNMWSNLGYKGALSATTNFAKWLTKVANAAGHSGTIVTRTRNKTAYFLYRPAN